MGKTYNKQLEIISQSVDTGTGELIEHRKTVTVKVNTDNFYFVFIEAISHLIGVTNGTELNVLSLLCINAEYNKGTCLLTPKRRKEFCEQLDINLNTFGIALSRLSNKGLIKNNRGNIEINPLCFWKGSIDQRNKLIKENRLEINIKFSDDVKKA